MGKKKSNAMPRWVPAVKTVTVLVTLALLFFAGRILMNQYVVFAGGRPVLLTGETVDLRDAQVSVQEYEKLKKSMPEMNILWSVPVGGQYFESASEYVIVDKLSEEDISTFSYFENLKTVDAMKCSDHGALAKLEAAYPHLEVNWAIHLGGRTWNSGERDVDLREVDVTVEELMNALGHFDPGAQIRLAEFSMEEDQKQQLTEAFPEHRFLWGVQLMGRVFSSGEKILNFAGETFDPAELIAVADQFYGVEEIDLTGCGFGLDRLCEIQQAYPDAFIRAEVSLHGLNLTTATEEIDLSGIALKNTEEIEQAVKVMPMLKKVIMSDCGFSDEEMDALNRKYEDILFVWTVHFSVYSLRTDAVGFCASDVPQMGYIAPKLSNADLEPLKYCTELVSLDLGHMHYKDLSFLENMQKLEYLILVDARYTDISILAQMKNLKYLELFKNNLDDLSPLLECKNLKHLNIGYTRGFDVEVLKQMTWLERLWYPGHILSEEEVQAIRDALPNTQVYMPGWDKDGSTGGGWREADVYFEMRNLFGMFYQPGGTGMNN